MLRVLVGCCIALAASQASAQSWPSKLIRIVVPFPPAGPTDIQARWAGQQLSAALGQQVIVENRPGAGTIIGVEALTKSPPDGYTLMVTNNSIAK